jgi:tetratricopeptide (TPR) repeat protein
VEARRRRIEGATFAGVIYIHQKNVHIGQRLGRLAEAATALREAIKLNPADLTSYYDLILSLQKLGQHVEAIEAFNPAIELKLDRGDAYRWLGESYSRKSDSDKAVSAFKKASFSPPSQAVSTTIP